MKICEFITSLSSGGAETFAIQFALTAKQHGHDVTVLLLKPIDLSTPFLVKRFQLLDNAGIRYASLNVDLKPFHQVRLLIKCILFFLKEHFDCVHTHNDREDVLVGICKIFMFGYWSVVSTLHNSVLPKKGLTAKLRFFFHRHVFHSVFCGKEALDMNRMDFPKSVYISNGIIFPESSDIHDVDNLPVLPANVVKLLSIGRLEMQKNHSCMIDAISILVQSGFNQIILLIAGYGSYYDRLAKQILDLHLSNHVFLLGERSDASNLAAHSDYFVSTSVYEGLPIAALEACAQKCPALLSPIPPHLALAEKIHGCRTAKDNTPQAMAELIEESMSSDFRHTIPNSVWEEDMSSYSMEKCFLKYEKLMKTHSRAI